MAEAKHYTRLGVTVKNLTRKPLTQGRPLNSLAAQELEGWQQELAARKAARPLPTQPSWAAQASKWGA